MLAHSCLSTKALFVEKSHTSTSPRRFWSVSKTVTTRAELSNNNVISLQMQPCFRDTQQINCMINNKIFDNWVLLQTDLAFNRHEVKFLQNRELGTWLTRLRKRRLISAQPITKGDKQEAERKINDGARD